MKLHLKACFLILLSFSTFVLGTPSNDKSPTIKEFFLASPYAHFTMHQNGRFIAYSESSSDKYEIKVHDVINNTSYVVYTAKRFEVETIKKEYYVRWVNHDNKIQDIVWLGNSVLALKETSKNSFRRFIVVKLNIEDNSVSQKKVSFLNQNGYWANPVVSSNRYAMFAKYKNDD
ncbi:hypothetical protein PSECIP111854_00535 [Pseudoalteromonas sp. CIP111854]|nr:hypothetical protein [Pseudoalteromonas sp. CIP111854]CAH9050460.1 hypothetical protein PSECIP111854_00535 [Pseudoalteromonas sp. CIP111854]